MRVLEYTGLDTSRVESQYAKVREAIERDDFRSADVKKLVNASDRKLYRARLDYANRLLFTVIRHGDSVCALMLEVVEQHAYEKSRFLRGAAVDDAKIPGIEAAATRAEAEPVRYLHPDRREIHLLDKVISFDDAQDEVYRLPPPLVVVGSAGSGKTALVLGISRAGSRISNRRSRASMPTRRSRKSAASSPRTRAGCLLASSTQRWVCGNRSSRKRSAGAFTACSNGTSPGFVTPDSTT